MSETPDSAVFLEQHTDLLMRSYARFFATPLVRVDVNCSAVEALLSAPFVLISHDTASEPCFNYANAVALNLFEYNWDEFTQLPSRLSAEAINQEERDGLLAMVKNQGFIQSYQGVRRSKTGRRFYITNAVVWNLIDCDNTYRGQAACFSDWRFL